MGEIETFSSERKRGHGARAVYDQLRAEILDLRLPPGSPLDEVELSKRFNLSRTPIREAMVKLVGEGLVATLPNRSTLVSQIDFLNMPVYFDALVLMYRATTQLAAKNHTANDMVLIRARQKEFAQSVAAQDALSMISKNADFHLAIAEAGKNHYFTSLFGRLLDEGRRILRLYYQSYNDVLPKKFVEEHEELISAIENRDSRLADHLAHEHANQVVKQVADFLSRPGQLDIEKVIP